jgi:hypothetical protein
MFIRTRDGLPVKSISDNGGEDEVIAPPGTALRCIRVQQRGSGVAYRPTVYLVAEDLVAEAEADSLRSGDEVDGRVLAGLDPNSEIV